MLENFNPASVEYYDAIKALSPEQLKSEWQEITIDQYWYWLGCLPPKVWKNEAFMVGECMTYHTQGAIYQACVQVGERYFTRPALLKTFDPQVYNEEIRNQFQI